MPELLEKVCVTSVTNVTLTTTSETVIISSGRVPVPNQTCLVHIRAWAQLTTGAGCTAVTPRIRRGSTTSGTVVGDEAAEQIKAVVTGIEPFTFEAVEQRSNEESVEYSFTLQQAGATGNGTVLQAAIEVEILGG